MRVTIIPADSLVIVDGVPVVFDFSDLVSTDVHAVQWFGEYGEVEFKQYRTPTGLVAPVSQAITSFEDYSDVLERYNSAKVAQEEEAARAAAEHAALEEAHAALAERISNGVLTPEEEQKAAEFAAAEAAAAEVAIQMEQRILAEAENNPQSGA